MMMICDDDDDSMMIMVTMVMMTMMTMLTRMGMIWIQDTCDRFVVEVMLRRMHAISNFGKKKQTNGDRQYFTETLASTASRDRQIMRPTNTHTPYRIPHTAYKPNMRWTR